MEYLTLKLYLPQSVDHNFRVSTIRELIRALKSDFRVTGSPENLIDPDSYAQFADLWFNLTNDSKKIRLRYNLLYWGSDNFRIAIEFLGYTLAEIKNFIQQKCSKFERVEGLTIIPKDRPYYAAYQWLRLAPTVRERNGWHVTQVDLAESRFQPFTIGRTEYWLLENVGNFDPMHELGWITQPGKVAKPVVPYNIEVLEDEKFLPATLYKDVLQEQLVIKVGDDFREQVFINDWFFTLRVLDEKLNQENRKIICNGTSKKVIALGACLDMGDGSLSYRYLDQSAKEARVSVDTLVRESWNEYVSEEVQLSGRFKKRFEANQVFKNRLREVSPDLSNILV